MDYVQRWRICSLSWSLVDGRHGIKHAQHEPMSVPPSVPNPLSALIEHGNKHFDFKKWAKVGELSNRTHCLVAPPPPPLLRLGPRP